MSHYRYHVVFEAVVDVFADEGQDPEQEAIAEARDLIGDPSFEPAKIEDWSDDLSPTLRSEDVP